MDMGQGVELGIDVYVILAVLCMCVLFVFLFLSSVRQYCTGLRHTVVRIHIAHDNGLHASTLQ